jgi:hypothetical protein
MTQLDTLKGGSVIGNRKMVLGGAIDELEDALGQASLRG